MEDDYTFDVVPTEPSSFTIYIHHQPVLIIKEDGTIVWNKGGEKITVETEKMLHLAFKDVVLQIKHRVCE